MALSYGTPHRFAGIEDLIQQAELEIENAPKQDPASLNKALLQNYNEPTVQLYRGESLTTKGGTFFSDNEHYAHNFQTGKNSRMLTVQVPKSIAEQASKAAAAGGNVGMQLPMQWADAAYEHQFSRENIRPALEDMGRVKGLSSREKMAHNSRNTYKMLRSMGSKLK